MGSKVKTCDPAVFRDHLSRVNKRYRRWVAEILWFKYSPSDARKGYEKEWHEFRERWVTDLSWPDLSKKRLQKEIDKVGLKIKIHQKERTPINTGGVPRGGRK